METWWHRYPKAFEAEKVALDALGHDWEINQEAFDAGRLVIVVKVPDRSEGELKLTAEFPATYPYFPPYVTTEEIIFSRHQHPIGKNLCLLARENEEWNPGHDTLAGLIRDQLPLIQEINTNAVSTEFVAEREDHVGEALSSFLTYRPNSALIVPDFEPPSAHGSGRLTIMCRPVPAPDRQTGILTGVVSSIQDMNWQELCTLPIVLPTFTLDLAGFWMRLSSRPDFKDESAFRIELFQKMRASIAAFDKAIKYGRRGQTFVAGFLYDDEVEWNKHKHDWIFLVVRIESEPKRGKEGKCKLDFIRTDWGGEQAWMQRAPALLPLRKKSAVLFGLGSLGSPVAIHLARAGLGKLSMIDSDYLQVGNTIRWALGWQHAGLDKALALTSYIRQEYPYTDVHGYSCRLGMISRPTENFFSDYDLIRELICGSNLVIDASANHRVSHFLSDLARELGKPYVWLTTTHGCAGGIVGRQTTQRNNGCWQCFLQQLGDGSIQLPPESTDKVIQPGGCSQSTFIGAGIDSDEIALLGGRLAVATLCRGEDAYPDFNWNVAVCKVQHERISIAPEWTTYPLNPHSACPSCSQS